MAIELSALKLPGLQLFKPRDAFAIDIGSSSVKILYLKKNGSKYTIQSCGVLPLSDGGADLSPLDKKNMITTRIAEFIAREKITSKNVISSVAGSSVVIRYVKLPKRTQEALQKTVQFEAEPYIPFDINDVDLGFHIIGDVVEEGQKKMETILVAAKKETSLSRMEVFAEMNLRPVVIDVDGFALVNAYETATPPATVETALIVNIGASTTNLVLIENHIPRVVRDIFIAGNSFNKSIQKNAMCDTKTAEDMKLRYSMLVTAEDKQRTLAENQKEAIQVSAALTSVARDLLIEIQKSIDFYTGQNPDKAVNRIVLSGGGALLKNLDAYLQQELKINVSYFNPLSVFGGAEAVSPEDAMRLAVAAGLAIRRENDISK